MWPTPCPQKCWCEQHLILPLGVWLSVVAEFICSKTSIPSMTRWNRKSRNLAHPLKANEMFAILNWSLCTNAHKPFLVLIWVWLNWCEECFTTNLLPQNLSGFLVEVDEFYTRVGSPSCIFHVIVPDEIWKNPLEYLEVQILDSLSARMRQQPEDVDHLRCNPTKTLR